MKHKILLANTVIVFTSLILLFSAFIFIINNHNSTLAKKELVNYLKITAEMYDGTNADQVIEKMRTANSSIRVTFIDFEGRVLNDTFNDVEFDLHNNRPEILKLGQIFTRYSVTLKQKMMYCAIKDEGVYVRVAIPVFSIISSIRNYILLSIISLVIIFLMSAFIISKLNKKAMKPLNDVVVSLSDIVGHNDYYGTEEIENITYQIKTIGGLLNEKIEMLTDEKDKVNFIIDNMNQGVVVINSNGKVMLINDYASRLFNYQKDEITDKHYIYLIRDLNFQSVIRETINRNNVTSFDVAIGDSIYLVSISSVTSKWNVQQDNHFGVLIIMVDVTDLRNIEKMKREFFANASHELKSPLTTILGYQELVAEGMISDKTEIIDAARRTVKEASRMNSIIMEMLELSRLESKETFEIANVNLKDIVTDTIDSFKQQVADRGIDIKLNLKDLIIPININHANQLIRNLVDNAIKYNKDHGLITISLQEKDNHKMFIIEDTGIGIAPEFQKRVFERFFRVDKARSKEMGGTGLGLSIVKHICILYNAAISLSSELNKGTRIVIKF